MPVCASLVDPDELDFWAKLYPNPSAILNLDDETLAYQPPSKSGVLAQRKARFGQNLKLTYTDPVMFLRGWKHHLVDEWEGPFWTAIIMLPTLVMPIPASRRWRLINYSA